jgi:ABC-type transporter Mla MlaB component
MLKITRMDEAIGRTTLQLEGRLTNHELGALEEAWRECLAERRCVVLDLAGVRYVDPAGVAALQSLQRNPVELRGCSAFVRGLLEGGWS